ncbi:regulatory-associated protein of mtor [Anaeramoeba flamelloides]|uniref:Regulatory-associated protein of mtor n=1 Tax=Anaeramoeba flamelloides TaxID=1746091 RepID=A0AAV7YZT1_9EUKA|nr:regulatory-associated protein of mtor [Anaeramoeba flamelloides]
MKKIPNSFKKSKYYLKWLTPPIGNNENWDLISKSKTQTELGILCTCLNLGIDPPDVVKPNPCSTLECWVNPKQFSKKTALNMIMKNLEKQFKSCEPRAEYIVSLDPTLVKLKKFCQVKRRTENNGRVLFYYNGHGVPRPSKKGEIWVFNDNYTQYIPLLVKELKLWLGLPSIYVFDCNYAGVLKDSFLKSEQLTKEKSQKKNNTTKKNVKEKKNQNQNKNQKFNQNNGTETKTLKNQLKSHKPNNLLPKDHQNKKTPTNNRKTKKKPKTIQCQKTKNKIFQEIAFFACSNYEDLPTDPKMPADLFASCLTTPIKTALRWHICSKFSSDTLLMNVNLETIENIPGDLNKRFTVLGELKQIFVSITESIAWTSFPNEIFQKLYRQDLLVATLFRNYLLAERIMKSYNCTPFTIPAIPETYKHKLWNSWDFVVDSCLSRINSHQNHNQPFRNSIFYNSQLNNHINLNNHKNQNNYDKHNKNYKGTTTTATTTNNNNNNNHNFNFINALIKNSNNPKINKNLNYLNLNDQPSKRKNKSKKKNRKKYKTMKNQQAKSNQKKTEKAKEWELKSNELNLKKHENNYLKSKQYLKNNTLLFFDDQLTGFEVWLNSGMNRKTGINKLPILLHTILNPLYSKRTLIILSRFFDLGRWAISEALDVGFLPYLKKFFRPNYKFSKQLIPYILFCWTKIIVFHRQQHHELTSILEAKFGNFFFRILTSKGFEDELYSLSAFILAQMQDSFHKIKNDCLSLGLLDICYSKLDHPSPNIRKWNSFCIAKQCENYQRAKNKAIQIGIDKKLLLLNKKENNPEIRATYVYTLSSIIGISTQKNEDFIIVREDKLNYDKIIILNVLLDFINDGSYLVRNECLLFLVKAIVYFEDITKLSIRILEKSRLKKKIKEQKFLKLWGFKYQKIIEKIDKNNQNIDKNKNKIDSSPLSIELNKNTNRNLKKNKNKNKNKNINKNKNRNQKNTNTNTNTNTNINININKNKNINKTSNKNKISKKKHTNNNTNSKYKINFKKNINLLFGNSLWKSLTKFCNDPFPRIYHMAIEITQLFLYYWDDYSKIENTVIFSQSFNNIFIRNSHHKFKRSIDINELTHSKSNDNYNTSNIKKTNNEKNNQLFDIINRKPTNKQKNISIPKKKVTKNQDRKKKNKMKKVNLLKQMEQRKKTEQRILSQSKRTNNLIKLAMRLGGIGMTSPKPNINKSLIRTIRRDGDSKYFRNNVSLKQILDVEKSNLFYWCTKELLNPLLYIITNGKGVTPFQENSISFNLNKNNLKEISSTTPKFSNQNSLFNKLFYQISKKSPQNNANGYTHQTNSNLKEIKGDNYVNNILIKKKKNQIKRNNFINNYRWDKYSISKIKTNSLLMKSNINLKDLTFTQIDKFSLGNQKLQNYCLHHFKPLFVYSNEFSEIIISTFNKQIPYSHQQRQQKQQREQRIPNINKNNNTNNKNKSNFKKYSKLSSLHLINQENNFLILSSYNNGIIKVWNNLLPTKENYPFSNIPKFSLNANLIPKSMHSFGNGVVKNSNANHKLKLIDSWNAFPNTDNNKYYNFGSNKMNNSNDHGIITDWLQSKSQLGVTGYNGIINIWDINYQKITNQFFVNLKKYNKEIVNFLNFVKGDTIITGTKNGSILQYDLRQNNDNNNPAFHLSTKDNSLINICLNQSRPYEITTATKNRLIQFWDIRFQKKDINSFYCQGKGLLNCFQRHQSLPIFASVTDSNEISIFDNHNNQIPILNKKIFKTNKFGKIKKIQFHPYQISLAIASSSNFSIFGHY